MILRAFMFVYSTLFQLSTPFVLAYLAKRGRQDNEYIRHLAERFGFVAPFKGGAVWVHAVSLGEVRSALPLIRELLGRGERVLITLFTPTGRREAERVLKEDISAGRVQVCWVPLETSGAFHRFFRRTRPRIGLVLEIEIWPQMVMAAERAGVPLFMCNAQYPIRSMARDGRGLRLRQRIMQHFAGAFVKSELQAKRFRAVGVPQVQVTGELRFDQPVPQHLVLAGHRLRKLAAGREIIVIASAVEGEDGLYIDTILQLLRCPAPPLVVYVPRAPERFDTVAAMLVSAGLAVRRRSELLDEGLARKGFVGVVDVLLGDSLGEMYAWLEMADRVVVGGGFLPSGAHNIIEPLALRRPVIVGPNTGTIEYPAEEAIAAGVCLRVTREGLADALLPGAFAPAPERIEAFFNAHSGAARRTADAVARISPCPSELGQ